MSLVEKLVERAGTNDVARLVAEVRIFEIEMKLSRRQLILEAGVARLNTFDEPWFVKRADLVSIEPNRRNVLRSSNFPRATAAVTEVDHDHVVRLVRKAVGRA